MSKRAPTEPLDPCTVHCYTGPMTTITEQAAADLSWLRNAENWGLWIRFSETEPAPPEEAWMMRHRDGRVRFYAVGKGQVGPEHKHVVAATYWAFGNRWMDPDIPLGLNLAARDEVLAGGVGRC